MSNLLVWLIVSLFCYYLLLLEALKKIYYLSDLFIHKNKFGIGLNFWHWRKIWLEYLEMNLWTQLKEKKETVNYANAHSSL